MTYSIINGQIYSAGITFDDVNIFNSFTNTNTWTPVLTASTTPPTSVSYTVQTGKYITIQNLVICGFGIMLSGFTLGPGAGDIVIDGLPFANPGAVTRGGAMAFANLTLPASTVQVVAEIPASSTQIKLFCSRDAAAGVYVDISGVTTTTFIQGACYYFI